MITTTKGDVLWTYLAQMLSILSGIIILPIILKFLSPEEIGLNYLMLSVSTMVALLDFGFTPQFSRNIAYVFSGAQKLLKEGLAATKTNNINYELLSKVIHSAKYIYGIIAFGALIIMLIPGSYYIYYVTNGFSLIDYSMIIWIIYSTGTFLNIYFKYYSSLLLGKGSVMESKKAIVYSRLTYIVLAFVFIYSELGLLGLVLANFIAPFISRYISHRSFFTIEMRESLSKYSVKRKDKMEVFRIIWPNSKKLGLVFIGSYAIRRLSIFLAGIYLPLSEIGSYGIMLQVFSLILTVSGIIVHVYEPRFASLRQTGENQRLLKDFALSMNIYYLSFIFGSILLISCGPYMLSLLSDSLLLPNNLILISFSVVLLLEGNHSNFSKIIVTKNNIPFVKSALIAGLFIGALSFLSLKYTSAEILGLVIVQGIVQLAYANWKWPIEALKDFKISYISFVRLGFRELNNRFLKFSFN